MESKSFKAQALALVMVVLVVASIIGVSLFSRMAKEKQASVNEQDSSISLSQVDAVLDYFVGADIAQIETVLGADDDQSITAQNFGTEEGTVDTLLTSVGVDSDDISLNQNWCDSNDETSGDEDYVKVSLEYGDSTEFIEYQPGSVAALALEGANPSDPCSVRLRFKAVENQAVFVLKKVFDDGTSVNEEMTGYCIVSGSADSCPSSIDNVEYAENLSSIVNYDTENEASYLDINLKQERDNDTVEIRVLPIKGVLGMTNEILNSGCIDDTQLSPIKITAEANCNGSYRGKQMFLPGSGNLGYSTLFDYGIYDSGLFQP